MYSTAKSDGIQQYQMRGDTPEKMETKKKVLMVAEKPLLAKWIAHILADGMSPAARPSDNGRFYVYEYNGTFLGHRAEFKVTSTLGHIMGLRFHEMYNIKWRDKDKEKEKEKDPIALFDAVTVKEEEMKWSGKEEKNEQSGKGEKKAMGNDQRLPTFLASEASGCDYLVLWLDCDKEGENICFEVMDAVAGMLKPAEEDQIYRARFSAVTAQDIKEAMNSLGRPNEAMSRSVDARKELDLRIGFAFTRFQTKQFEKILGDACISYGPCQTPTLGFCVSRSDEIEQFETETYWELQVTLSDGERERNITLKPKWDRGAAFDQEVAQFFFERIKQFAEGKVVEIRSEECREQKPVGLNTVELLRVVSSQFLIGPTECMDIAERLYTAGYLSYVRTETTSYPPSFDLTSLLVYLAENAGTAKWADAAKVLKHRGVTRPREGHKAGDHPPITPIEVSSSWKRRQVRGRIYDYVCRRFLATISEDYKYTRTSAIFQIGDESFTASRVTVIDAGFTRFLPEAAITEPGDLAVLSLRTGQRLKIIDVKLVEKETQPPEYLTESDVITLMDEHRIGTDCSIPGHISTIRERNYVKLETTTETKKELRKRLLVPTKLGKALVHGYHRIDPELVKPEMRAAVEKELDQIARGISEYDAVVGHVLGIYRQKFKYFQDSIKEMEKLLRNVRPTTTSPQQQRPRTQPLTYKNERSSFPPSPGEHNTDTSPSSQKSIDTSIVSRGRSSGDASQMDSSPSMGDRRDYFRGQGDTSGPVGRQVMNSVQDPGELRGVRPAGISRGGNIGVAQGAGDFGGGQQYGRGGIGRGGNIGTEQGGGDFGGGQRYGVIGNAGIGRGIPVASRK